MPRRKRKPRPRPGRPRSGRRWLRWGAAGAAGVLLLFTALVLLRQPSLDRDWRPEQAVLAEIDFDHHQVTIRNIRDYRHPPAAETEPGYYDATFDLHELESAWLVLSPFAERWRGPAHSFLSFGFADGRFLSISVEARRERGVDYSAFRGLFNRYELFYVVGDERDLVALRAATWEDPVHLYPVRATPRQIREVLVTMLRRAERLRHEPEFYHTFFNNCTTNIIAAVNEVSPRRIPRTIAAVLPGYADSAAQRLGLIPDEVDLATLRAESLVDPAVAARTDDPHYSLRIRGLNPPE